jgi:hypothetical protein
MATIAFRRTQACVGFLWTVPCDCLTSGTLRRDHNDNTLSTETDAMWWLSFRGGVVIVEAASLIHARLLAAQCEFSRASEFVAGYFIDPDRAALIPNYSIGRMLSPVEVRELVKLLKYGPHKYVAKSNPEPVMVPSRRRA